MGCGSSQNHIGISGGSPVLVCDNQREAIDIQEYMTWEQLDQVENDLAILYAIWFGAGNEASDLLVI